MAHKDASERSDRFPHKTLSSCVALALKLVERVSRKGGDVATVLAAMGYTRVSGSSKNTLAAMKAYGLIEKPHGKNVVMPTDALLVLRTGTDEEKAKTCRSLALKPPVFACVYAAEVNPQDEALLERMFIMHNLPVTTAKQAARIYRENAEFVGLAKSKLPFQLPLSAEVSPLRPPPLLPGAAVVNEGGTAGIDFNFPLVSCDARLRLSRENFDLQDIERLQAYIELLKGSWRVGRELKASPRSQGSLARKQGAPPIA
jgi:hypothetical protein